MTDYTLLFSHPCEHASFLNLDELRDVEHRESRRRSTPLMVEAGQKAASVIEARYAPDHAVVLVGPGQNGGDGLWCARFLKEKGVQVSLWMKKAPTDEVSRQALQALDTLGVEVYDDPYQLPRADVVVDALFGIGLKRPITGDYYEAIQWFNERHAHKVALDVPSGIDFQTGNRLGNLPSIRADLTISFLANKPGLYLRDGIDAAGEVLVDNLGVSIPLTRLTLNHVGLFDHVLAPRASNTHKGHYGHVGVMGGREGMQGALLMSARSALMMGAGRVTMMTPEGTPLLDPLYPELMSAKPDFSDRFSVLVVGPGLGTDDKAKALVEAALLSDRPLVLDADALTLISQHMPLQDKLLARSATSILTPHEMEAARLLRCDLERITQDRVGTSRELAVQSGAMVVLKGPGTLLSLRTAVSWLNPTGSARLATAGSGDVLAGMIGGLLAQGFDRVEACLAAIYVHGLAGHSARVVRASDILEASVDALAALRQARSAQH